MSTLSTEQTHTVFSFHEECVGKTWVAKLRRQRERERIGYEQEKRRRWKTLRIGEGEGEAEGIGEGECQREGQVKEYGGGEQYFWTFSTFIIFKVTKVTTDNFILHKVP